MCGIFAYSGVKHNATNAVFDGLKSLDYRGYDSWGISITVKDKILTNKYVGLANKKLLRLPESQIAIGHTRWATTGGVTKINAHPHLSSDGSFALAQNGIVENFAALKKELIKKGYKFISQTDTEVIVHLIEEEIKTQKDFSLTVQAAFKKCLGRNTIIILTKNGEIFAVRNGSPLVVGIPNEKNEIFISSDTLSLAPYVAKTITLDNNQMIIYKNNNLDIKDILNGKNVKLKIDENKIKGEVVSKGKYQHFMIKEIFEQPEVIKRILLQSKMELLKLGEVIKNSKTVYCIGSGTAGAAAFQTAYYLRTFSKINAIGLIGAEAKEYNKLFSKKDLIISLSQSGETADVLEVLEFAKKKGVKIASYVNMEGSLMTKLSDFPFMAHAGPEICVMSTKVFVSQIAWGYLLSKAVQNKYTEGVMKLKSLIIEMEKLLDNKKLHSNLNRIASKLKTEEDVFLLGKGQNLQIIKEGMIKIIEGSYIHAHAIPAGDLKHYAITLMKNGVNVIVVVSDDENKVDTINAIHEIKARGASIIAISSKKDDSYDQFVKTPELGEVSAILNIVPLQLFAYRLALLRGNSIDKPRNIAKSVTVK